MDRHPHLHASPHPAFATRREFLSKTGSGFGLLALTGLLQADAGALPSDPSPVTRHPSAANPLSAKHSHFPARAKSVIWLFMNGGPSQVDTWDYKPELEKHDGQELKGF